MYEKVLNLTVGFVGAVVGYAFGGWSEALALLVILTVMDWITGLSASAYEGYKNPDQPERGLSSRRGFFGILKKVLMFTVIAVLYRIDILLGLNGTLSLAMGATYFYIANELISLVENYIRLDLPIAPQLKRAIAALKENGSEKDKDDKKETS